MKSQLGVFAEIDILEAISEAQKLSNDLDKLYAESESRASLEKEDIRRECEREGVIEPKCSQFETFENFTQARENQIKEVLSELNGKHSYTDNLQIMPAQEEITDESQILIPSKIKNGQK